MFDLAVIGCGGIGSAVMFHAAQQGARVVGCEQFNPAHDRGSSHGHTRIIRQAYFEHPNYVPLLLEAYDLWAELEQLVGEQLYVQTGLLQAGPAEGVVVPGVLRSAAEHDLQIDRMTAQEAMQRFPAFRIPEDHVAAYEHRAGYLFVERCVAAHLRAAEKHGAELRANCPVTNYIPTGSGYRLSTAQGEIEARSLVITVGAWLPHWLAADIMPLQVLRKHLHWFHSSDINVRQSRGCPLFFFENDVGCYYGFPAIDAEWGLKVAEHSGGEPLSDPHWLPRSRASVDDARIDAFVSQYFHGQHTRQRHVVCMYTMTSDQHFLIDHHPSHARVIIAGGFSGHGFKFASVLGKRIAHAALSGQLDERMRFLGIGRG